MDSATLKICWDSSGSCSRWAPSTTRTEGLRLRPRRGSEGAAVAGGHRGGGNGQGDSRGAQVGGGSLTPCVRRGHTPCPGGKCPSWGRGSPGNEAVGSCHHPLGPHQEAPADVLPVHLDGGDEGPGMGYCSPSPDDLAPLGAWWVQVIFGLLCATGESRVPTPPPGDLALAPQFSHYLPGPELGAGWSLPG